MTTSNDSSVSGFATMNPFANNAVLAINSECLPTASVICAIC
ncbi:hypothetical protein [Paenibacillus sp. HWE-109]|nr:hypothetical protein [Paenibacillus sp. HWE-109]